MEWYEIIGVVVIWFLGLYQRGKFYEYLMNKYYNGSWKRRKKLKMRSLFLFYNAG
jgi:hypothetical protein